MKRILILNIQFFRSLKLAFNIELFYLSLNFILSTIKNLSLENTTTKIY